MLFVLAQMATSAEVQAARSDLRTAIWWAAFIFGASCLFYGFNRTWAAVTSFWAKFKEDLRLRPTATTAEAADQSMRTAVELPAASVVSALQPQRLLHPGIGLPIETLLASMANDKPVTEATIITTRSDGKRYETSYSIKEVAANG